MFPKKGNLFPGGNDRDSRRQNLPGIVARALRAELGPSHRAAKTLMRWTGASERTVKQWLSGVHAPRGEHLVALLGKSDAVFESVMTAADRYDVVLAARAFAARTAIDDPFANINDGPERPQGRRSHDAPMTSAAPSGIGNDRENDRNDDRMGDRDSGRTIARFDRLGECR